MRKRDHGDGGIDERGPDRWRLRWRVSGKRYSKAFHGTKRAAQTELRRLLKSADDGVHIAPDKTTVAEYLQGWLVGTSDLSPKTRERYRQLVEQQIIPHLGCTVLQTSARRRSTIGMGSYCARAALAAGRYRRAPWATRTVSC